MYKHMCMYVYTYMYMYIYIYIHNAVVVHAAVHCELVSA